MEISEQILIEACHLMGKDTLYVNQTIVDGIKEIIEVHVAEFEQLSITQGFAYLYSICEFFIKHGVNSNTKVFAENLLVSLKP